MIEVKIDFTKADDVAWLQSLRADARPIDRSTDEVSRCIYSGDVLRKDINDCLSGKLITFD